MIVLLLQICRDEEKHKEEEEWRREAADYTVLIDDE